MEFPAAVLTVVALLQAAGARLVTCMGGAIVDLLRGVEPADYDLEAFGLSANNIEYVLTEAGHTAKAVQAEHNGHMVVKCFVDGVPIDIAAPEVNEWNTACRRDLTINSLFYAFGEEQLVDHFQGKRDLANEVLRCTSTEWFPKTPANVLRIAQFLSRGKGKHVDYDTDQLCEKMGSKATTVPGELVKMHLDKLLLGANPDKGLQWLHNVGWLMLVLPEVARLNGRFEKPEWHPEGDSFQHTMRVVANAAQVRDSVPEEWRLAFMYAALFHDVGKAVVWDPEQPGVYKGHDVAAELPVREALGRFKASKDLTAKVLALCVNHMQCGGLTRGGARKPAWRRLHNKVRLLVAGWLSRCDWAAHPEHDLADESHQSSKNAFAYDEEFGPEKLPALVQGRHLIRAGLKPGPHFQVALKAAYEQQLEDPSTDLETLIAIAVAAVA